MEQTRNGGGKVVTFEEAVMLGRHRNGSLPAYNRDIGVARPLQGGGSRRRTYGDGELDVFAAERYFKGAMDDGAVTVAPPPPAASAAARRVVAVGKPAGTRASAAASVASASSAATSANSRTALLRRRRGHHGESRKCCVHVGALVRSCSGKRAVRVDDTGVVAANKEGVVHPAGAGDQSAASKVDWYKELWIQKAALGVVAGGDGVVADRGVAAATTLPPNLNSLGAVKVAAVGREVMPPSEKAAVERTRSFTLVAPVRANNVPASTGDAGGSEEHNKNDDEDYDGAGSESSSDLFEIKSLMIDECSYEPSEASVQWSVTTATASERGGGDRGASSCVGGGGGHRGRGPIITGRLSQGRPPAGGMLSGCVSHKAVEVSAATAKVAVPNASRKGFHQKARHGA